jgi:hypothetical protein
MASFLRRRRDLARDAEAIAFAEEYIGENGRLSPVAQLEIYREQFYLRHTASLVDDFPGLGGILGQRDWDELVWGYLESIAPTSYDLADLGAGLAAYIGARESLENRELLLDMARLEYSHLEVFDAPDGAPLDPQKLAAVPDDAWERVRLVPDPGLCLLEFRYPVTELRRRILAASADDHAPAVALPAPEPGHFAVHRRARAIHHDRLDPRAFALLAAITRGEPLGAACESAARALTVSTEELGAELESWFKDWSTRGYLVDVLL